MDGTKRILADTFSIDQDTSFDSNEVWYLPSPKIRSRKNLLIAAVVFLLVVIVGATVIGTQAGGSSSKALRSSLDTPTASPTAFSQQLESPDNGAPTTEKPTQTMRDSGSSSTRQPHEETTSTKPTDGLADEIDVETLGTEVTTTSQPNESPTQHPTRRPTLHPVPSPTTAPTRGHPKFRLPFLINAGTSGTDSRGNEWVSDATFASGTLLTEPTCLFLDTAIDAKFFCNAREGNYEIPVPNGSYQVTLHLLAESNAAYAVLFENRQVYWAVGSDRLVSFHATADIHDGGLSIRLDVTHKTVAVAALEIHEAPDLDATRATYAPGNLTVQENGLILSKGLTAKLVAAAGQNVTLANGSKAAEFHIMPDAGACFRDTRSSNVGGWIYASNSEAKPEMGPGGVGALTFDSDGRLLGYEMVLEGTQMNCGGGTTPWGAWISGEEIRRGKIWQIDPTGERKAETITMGDTHSGLFESFAHDLRDLGQPRFFMTVDHELGALRRFTPHSVDWTNPWAILTGEGNLEYLVVTPTQRGAGRFRWVSNHTIAAKNAEMHFPNSEGIDVNDNMMYFVSKRFKTMFELDLESMTYTNRTTRHGLFGGQPDQIVRMFGNAPREGDELLYFTEDGGRYAGVHARNERGEYYTILESHEYADETTGLSFSPDNMHMYVAYQDNGLLFDVTRVDGLPFHAKTLNVKFHNSATG